MFIGLYRLYKKTISARKYFKKPPYYLYILDGRIFFKKMVSQEEKKDGRKSERARVGL
jgi:hypothetical protein